MTLTRKCGDCQLCCRLLPVRELAKPGNTRCQHQKHGKGCAIYARRPFSCASWNCRWLLSDDTLELRRPDRAGYVIDVSVDFVTLRNELNGQRTNVPVMQVWVDPNRPDDWQDDRELFKLAERQGHRGIAMIVRNGEHEATAVFPPELSQNGEWNKIKSDMTGEATHTAEDIMKAGFGALMMEQVEKGLL